MNRQVKNTSMFKVSSLTRPIHTHTPTFVFVEELASLFCRLGFAFEGFVASNFFFAVEDEEEAVEDEVGFLPTEDEDDGGDEDFNLANSASKAGARVLTIVSRSDILDRDWRARRTKTKIVSDKIATWWNSVLRTICSVTNNSLNMVRITSNVCNLSNLVFPEDF